MKNLVTNYSRFSLKLFLKHVTLVEEMKYGLDIFFLYWRIFNQSSTTFYLLWSRDDCFIFYPYWEKLFIWGHAVGHEGKVRKKNGFSLNYLWSLILSQTLSYAHIILKYLKNLPHCDFILLNVIIMQRKLRVSWWCNYKFDLFNFSLFQFLH